MCCLEMSRSSGRSWGKLAEQHVDLSCLAYIVVTPDGLGTYETADMQSFSSLLGDLPRADFSVLIRMTYAYSANGSFKAWRIADSGPPQQVLVHFLLKPCEGESFQVVDIERPDADLRSNDAGSIVRSSWASDFPSAQRSSQHRHENREPRRFRSRSPTCSTPRPRRRNICGFVYKQFVATSGPFGERWYSKSTLRCKLSSAMHQAPPRTLVWMPRKLHSSIIGRMASSTA